MSTILETAPLSSDELRALRSSDSVSFHARWQDGELTESVIRGRKRDAVGEDYIAVALELPSTLAYGGQIIRENADVRAYESVLSARFHEHWATIVSLLRAGDRLTLVWSANGGRNEIVRGRGLAVDELSVRVDRGKRRMFFHVDTRITEYNSARMFSLGDSFAPVSSDRDREIGL